MVHPKWCDNFRWRFELLMLSCYLQLSCHRLAHISHISVIIGIPWVHADCDIERDDNWDIAILDYNVNIIVMQINLSGLGSQNQQPSHSDMEQASQPRSAVAWVSGYDAVGMENSSDDEVKEEFKRLFKDFPTLDLSTDFQVSKGCFFPEIQALRGALILGWEPE